MEILSGTFETRVPRTASSEDRSVWNGPIICIFSGSGPVQGL